MKAPIRSSNRPFTVATLSRILVVVVVVVGLGGIVQETRADGKGDTAKASPQAAPTKEKGNAKKSQEAIVITGSLIPQNIRPDRIPVTTMPVMIISQSDIQRSGKATLPGVLRQQLGR